MIDVRLEGVDDLESRLGRVAAVKTMLSISLAAGEIVRDRLAVYPGAVKYPILWLSEKQKRAYFARRREEGLGLPYHRTMDRMSQNLGKSWTTSPIGAMEAELATKVSYAKWVQGADDQQPMHANTGWITDEQAVEQAVKSGDVEEAGLQILGAAMG